jgi:hypothetical protein
MPAAASRPRPAMKRVAKDMAISRLVGSAHLMHYQSSEKPLNLARLIA